MSLLVAFVAVLGKQRLIGYLQPRGWIDGISNAAVTAKESMAVSGGGHSIDSLKPSKSCS